MAEHEEEVEEEAEEVDENDFVLDSPPVNCRGPSVYCMLSLPDGVKAYELHSIQRVVDEVLDRLSS